MPDLSVSHPPRRRRQPEPEHRPTEGPGDLRDEGRRLGPVLGAEVRQLLRRDVPDEVETAGDVLRVLPVHGVAAEQGLGTWYAAVRSRLRMKSRG